MESGMQSLLKNMFVAIVILFTLSVSAWGQQMEHPLDFEEGFFKKSPFSRWMRDPFKNPPGFAKHELSQSKWPAINGITFTEKAQFVILDGKRFKEGQFIDEERYVSSIGQNFVIITEGNFDYELVYVEPKRGLAGEKK